MVMMMKAANKISLKETSGITILFLILIEYVKKFIKH